MYDKKSDPVLTEYDITINGIHQENMFKGTIAVCILYAVFAFILICAAYFSDNIRELLFDKFLPFTLIYIVGTIIIIMIFIYFVLSFEPKKVDINKIDENISCPDYWKLEILDDNVIENSFDVDKFNKKLFKYRCVMDDKIFNKASIYKQDKKTPNFEQYRLGNKPAFLSKKGVGTDNGDAKTNIYNDIYNDSSTTAIGNFIENTKDNDKDFYLYKNLNAYNNVNLNYTNTKIVSDNILDDLKQSALIMNNYKMDETDENNKKYVDITNAGANKYDVSANNLNHRYTSNYYNTPAILTWATSDANSVDTAPDATANSSTSYNNIAVGNSLNANYTATVYDWSTMTNKTLTGNVYAIDTSSESVNNFVLLGEIKKNGDKLYFQGSTSITIPATTFVSKQNYNNYYFDDTYLLNTTISASTNIPLATKNTYDKGPKVRIFHKTERAPEILKNDLDKTDTKKLNIPLTCSAVYPSFLASKEDKYSENNTLRCAYSKICNIPWSDLHCNDIKLSAYPS